MNKQTLEKIVNIAGPLPFRLIGKWMIQICNSLKSQMKSDGEFRFRTLTAQSLLITESLNIEVPPPSAVS